MLLLCPLLSVLEAESWGCSAEQCASLSALGKEPRLRLARFVTLIFEFLELLRELELMQLQQRDINGSTVKRAWN